MLRIRQAFCRQAVRYIEHHKQGHEAKLINELTQLLHLLLPQSPRDGIAKAATKFVKKAVSMKHSIMEETAVYHAYWVHCSADFDDNSAECGDDGTGRVYICTFPGLSRTVDKDGTRDRVFVVKASVVLESVFTKQME